MKKVILSLVFVFATGTMMNANSTNEIIITPTTETVEIIKDFGCASACVGDSKAAALAFAQDDESLVETYMGFYTSCYDARCR